MSKTFDGTRRASPLHRAWRWLAAATAPLSYVAASGVACIVLAEIVWRTRHGISSPLLALVYVAAALVIGSKLRKLALSHARTHEWIESLLAGEIVLSASYVALACLRWQRVYPALVAVLAAGCIHSERRSLARARVSVRSVAFALLLLSFCARAALFVDRLSLTTANPTGFAWIDTPLWLDMAYGIERACPVPDLLVTGHVANYHFGASALVSSIRALTRLPMHVAYYTAMCLALTSLCFASSRIARLLVRPSRRRRLLCTFVVPWFGLVWIEYFVFNFPSVVALPLMLFGVTLALRAPGMRSFLLWLPLFSVLVLTKEVAYFFLGLVGTCTLLLHARKASRLASLVPFGLAAVISRPLYEWLVRLDQHPRLMPFTEHFDPDWIRDAVAKESHVLALCLGLAAFLWSARARWPRLWLVPSIASLVHATGFLLTAFVKPTFDPPMDPFSYHWTLFDMGQFESNGRQMALVALGVTVVALLASRRDGATLESGRLVPVLSVLFIGYVLVNTWRSQFLPEHVEQDRHDPVAELLAQIPTQHSVLASNRRYWNHENPHWAAFFGHQFYMSRAGRWATAYRDYTHRLDVIEQLFASADPQAMETLIGAEGITHVVIDKTSPPPWVAGLSCVVENSRYCIVEAAAPQPAR